jgi:RNA polymerase sigma factor for flagellar operon FliA
MRVAGCDLSAIVGELPQCPPLEVECASVLPTPEKAEILERYQSAVDLVTLVARQVRRAVGPAVSVAELVSCGNEGLLDAARRFDASRRVSFRAYAQIRIRGAILDGVRAIMPLPRRTWEKLRGIEAVDRVSASLSEDEIDTEPAGGVPAGTFPLDQAHVADAVLADHLAAMATAMAVGMLSRPVVGECGEPTPGDEHDDPEQAALRAERERQLEQAMLELPREEAILVRQHYIEGQRFDRVAERLGLSKSWASRLHRRAMDRLAKTMQEGEEP